MRRRDNSRLCCAGRRAAGRGYNLIETGIILAVVALIIGGSVLPLGRLWESNAIRSEREIMRAIQDAIVGYAMQNGTAARRVEVLSDNGSNSKFYTIPAGRPYLPCPDVTGDGYEDRGGVPPPGVLLGAQSYQINTDGVPFNQLLQLGVCAASRGALPWKTLGVAGGDRWGNRYTYGVDDVMAAAATGFDHTTILDSFDIRQAPLVGVAGQLEYQPRSVSADAVLLPRPGDTDLVFAPPRRPILICGDGNGELCQPDNTVMLTLAAGRRAVDGNVAAARRVYQLHDVIEGAAYVLVSHGKNGHGAVRHFNAPGAATDAYECNTPVNGADRLETLPPLHRLEAVNYPLVEAAEGNVLPAALRFCFTPIIDGRTLVQGYFNHVPHIRAAVGGVDAEYDDIVLWAMHDDVTNVLSRAQKVPVQRLPVFRAY